MRALLGISPVCLLLAACVQAGPPATESTAAAEAEIRRMVQQYTDAMAAGDIDRFVGLFTDDAVLMPPDEPAVRGLAAYEASIRPYFEQFDLAETLSLDEIHVAGDWAAASFTYAFSATPKGGGDTMEDSGKGLGLLRRADDGTWKWSRSIWNRDEAPAPSAAP